MSPILHLLLQYFPHSRTMFLCLEHSRSLTLKPLYPQGGEESPITDQWLPPFVIVGDDEKPVGTIEDGDAVVLFNFRADRMVQISKAFEYEKFDAFDRKRFPKVREHMRFHS